MVLSAREGAKQVTGASTHLEDFARRLLTVSKRDVAEIEARRETRDIDSSPAEVAALRRAKQQVSEGKTKDIPDWDKWVAEQEASERDHG